MKPVTIGEIAFHTRLKNWIALRKSSDAPVGVMIRTTETDRWQAWRSYFERHDCGRELARMRLCEQDRPYSREPGTGTPWMQVPADWPNEFDRSETDYAGRRG